jgi:L-alanine-DL-glutamate epimerase-like enolase superfamily enzyme
LSDWERLKELELHIDDYEIARLERDVSSHFLRVSTEIRLRGAGEEGIGEDVIYDAEDHDAAVAAGTTLPLAGSWTLGSFAEHVERLDLFPVPPQKGEVSRLYRIYAYESAALDLALRQAGTSLHAFVGREPRPLTYVVSLRLGEPPSLDPVTSRLERYPGLRFKLDPTPSWTDELVEQLAATGSVDSVDFKGFASGTIVDNLPDPAMYERVVNALPTAWIEDPHRTPEIDALLEPHRDRITWDAPIHGIADIEALPFPPRMVNVKPSRTGPLSELFATYAYCAERNIGMYGGGQFELGAGRGQIQLLASLYHPDTPNDVSPSGFHVTDPPAGLPESPLPPAADERGFRWTA